MGGNFYGSGVPEGSGVKVAVNANGDSCDTYNNIFLEPILTNPAQLAFSLQSTSPCINAGSPTLPRDPDNTVVDIGAISYSISQGVINNRLTNLPQTITLEPAYPNPFNPSTRFRYELAKPIHLRLGVYDDAGRLITTLVQGNQSAGTHEVSFDGSGLASGVYFIRLSSVTSVLSERVILLK
ncbi:MAG: T9SS type A sorting domain-containing protein [bacterium]|nr:T9SS type A sorting domain-containing protein [bacterium]